MNTQKDNQNCALPMVRLRLNLETPLFLDKSFGNEGILDLMSSYLSDLPKETSMVLCLDMFHHPICVGLLSNGTEMDAEMSPRDVMQIALLAEASNIVLFHNHPVANINGRYAQSIQASENDIRITELVRRAGLMMGVNVVDSIIVCPQKENGKFIPAYYSMRKNKIFKKLDRNFPKEYMGTVGVLKDVPPVEKLDWDSKAPASAYFGIDVDEIKTHPRIVCHTPQQLAQALKDVKQYGMGSSVRERYEAFQAEMKQRKAEEEELLAKVREIKARQAASQDRDL